jgi:lipopolysaccharide export system protein LptA
LLAATVCLGLTATIPWAPATQAAEKPAPAAEKPAKISLFADQVTHDKMMRQSRAQGHVRLVQGDVMVFADGLTYDEATDTSTTDGKATIVQAEGERKTVITTAKLTFFHRERRALLDGQVHVDRPADPTHVPAAAGSDSPAKRQRTEKALKAARTIIDAAKGEYWTRTKKGRFEGDVKVLQKEKKATGDVAELDDPAGLVVLSGKAHVEQIKGNWLVIEGIIEDKPDDVEQQQALRHTATIDGDRIEIYTRTNDLIATGNVVAEQKSQISRSQKAVYRDKEQLLTLTDTVKFERQKDEWMTADRAVYDLAQERFQAFGEQKQIESKFLVRTDPTPAAPLPPENPDHDLGPLAVPPTPVSGPPGMAAASPPPPSVPPSPAPTPGPSAAATAPSGSDRPAVPSPSLPSGRIMQPGPVLTPSAPAGSGGQPQPVVPRPSLQPTPVPSLFPTTPQPTRTPRGPRLPRPTVPPPSPTPRPQA